MARRIYLDNHASTPCDPRVVEAMRPWHAERPGNASSTHLFGWEAREAVARSAEQCAELIACDPKEIIFTSGATESNALALLGVARRARRRGEAPHFVVGGIEHPSVLACARQAEAEGASLSRVEPDGDGILHADAVAAELRDDTALCSVGWAHNEIGVVQPIAEISARCRERGVLLHSDATQALGRIPVDSGLVDLLSFSGHKMYGPKGIGALYVRRRPRVRLDPLWPGGGQQDGLRPGTLPTALIVGLGEAAACVARDREADAGRLTQLADRLRSALFGALDDLLVNGAESPRLPGSLNVSFLGVEAQAILLELPGLALSSGSACSAESAEPSPTLLAIGRSADEAHCSLRFGLGRFTTEAEIDEASAAIVDTVRRLRSRGGQRSPRQEEMR